MTFDGGEADWETWVDLRVGRIEFEMMPRAMQELAHAAFMEGRYSKALKWDAETLINQPGMRKKLTAAVSAAQQHRAYLMTLLCEHVEKDVAMAMTIAYIQSTGMKARFQLPPEERDKEDWQK